jgi:hypothetical protein
MAVSFNRPIAILDIGSMLAEKGDEIAPLGSDPLAATY